MAVITKDELRNAGSTRQETVQLQTLGGAEVTIRAYSVKDRAAIIQASISYTADGTMKHDPQQDQLLSLCACMVDPVISLEDTGWAQELDAAVIDEILGHANRLSRRTQSDYDELKAMFRLNGLARRLWMVCVDKFGTFPDRLEGVSEEQFLTYLAAVEVQDELEQEAQAEQAA